MAEIKHTWSVPTSPRSPYKLPQTLALLKEYEDKIWDRKTQNSFAKKLAESESYEGKVPANSDFAARDRINRAPTTFGFLELKPKITITAAGKRLMTESNLEELFTRQLLKWQYPSPKYKADKYSGFNIKPFLEILRLVSELDGLSKREIAIFCLPFIDFRNFEKVKNGILDFRKNLNQLKGVEKKRYVIQQHKNYYKLVYQEEINSGSFKIRERKGKTYSADDFVKTKMRNSTDYSDAAIRYFRASGLFKLSATTFRLQIIESKKEIVDQILATQKREPEIFRGKEREFLDVLGNPDLPVLPDDLPEILQIEIAKLVKLASERDLLSKKQVDLYRKEQLVSATAKQLKQIRSELEKILEADLKQVQLQALQSYSLFDDVIKMYDKIVLREDYDIPDKPLFFEWNTWRAFTMLDDGEVICNAILDKEGKPLSVAPGGGADNICYYKDFAMIVEVTLMRGERQFEAEHESVPRHLGKLVKAMRGAGDTRPVYGIFIASGINPSTVANFYNVRRTEITHYGGKAKIIPIELNDFKKMLAVAKTAGGIKSEQIKQFIEWADNKADSTKNESEWYELLKQQIPNWNRMGL